MKKLKVFSMILFAAIMLVMGTGIIIAQAYKAPEQNYLFLGTSLLTQNQNSAVANPLDQETIARIEKQSLTSQEIPEVKEKLQNSLNKGFENWVTSQPSVKGQIGGLSTLLSKADNETMAALFFSFLGENQEYQELFKLYDQVLMCENYLLMQEMYPEVDQKLALTSLILSNGTIIREENTTRIENGTTYTIVEREYALEINGTTCTAVKISVYDSEGRVLVDPNVCIYMFPLVYWLQILWWGSLIWYGNDYYVYIHFPILDEAWYLLDVWASATNGINNIRLPFQIANLVSFAIPGPVGLAIGAAAMAFDLLVAYIGGTIRAEIMNICLATVLYNGVWGFRTLERLHYIWGWCPWDIWTSITYFVVNKDGAIVQLWPYSGWAVLNTLIGGQATNMAVLYTAFVSTYGNGQWVYMGAYVPVIYLTSHDGDIWETARQIIDASSTASAGLMGLALNAIVQAMVPKILGFL